MTTLALSPSRIRMPNLTWTQFAIHPAFLQLVALVPVLCWFVKRLDDGSDEPLGLLTFALAISLAWRDRHSLISSTGARTIGAFLLLLSVVSIHGFPPMVRAVLAITGIAAWHGVHRRGGLMGLLILSLPVVASLQFFFGYPLRVAAAEGAVRILELASIVVARSGTQIELGGHVVGVDPACGGVRMLWHALAAALALAAFHRLTWRATICGGLLAVVLVIPANIFRATLLVLQETGHFPGLVLGHDGVGLACFALILAPLWLVISSRARPASPAVVTVPSSHAEWRLLVVAAVMAPLLMLASPRRPGPPEMGVGPEVFTFDGLTLPLAPLPPSPAEMAFAESFPGTLASYRWGDCQVILRWVTTATRRLHSSRDCLRAAGFETTDAVTVRLSDGSEWARFFASRAGIRWVVSERIVSQLNHRAWTDVSAWYWTALRRPLNGPWQAETVIAEN